MLNNEANENVNKSDSFLFEVYVAKIICRKDNANILKLTAKADLTRGLKNLATKQLNTCVNKDGNGDCCLGQYQ